MKPKKIHGKNCEAQHTMPKANPTTPSNRWKRNMKTIREKKLHKNPFYLKCAFGLCACINNLHRLFIAFVCMCVFDCCVRYFFFGKNLYTSIIYSDMLMLMMVTSFRSITIFRFAICTSHGYGYFYDNMQLI